MKPNNIFVNFYEKNYRNLLVHYTITWYYSNQIQGVCTCPTGGWVIIYHLIDGWSHTSETQPCLKFRFRLYCIYIRTIVFITFQPCKSVIQIIQLSFKLLHLHEIYLLLDLVITKTLTFLLRYRNRRIIN